MDGGKVGLERGFCDGCPLSKLNDGAAEDSSPRFGSCVFLRDLLMVKGGVEIGREQI